MSATSKERRRINLNGLLDRMFEGDFKRTYCGPYDRKTMAVLLKPLFKKNRWGKRRSRINWAYFLFLRQKAIAKYDREIELLVDGEKRTVYLIEGDLNSVLMAFLEAGVLTTDFCAGKIYWVKQYAGGSAYSCLCILPSTSSFQKQLYFSAASTARDYYKAFQKYPFFNGRKPIYMQEVNIKALA